MIEAVISEPISGIFQLTLPYKPISDVNVFAIPDQRGLTVIDAGPGDLEYAEVLDRALAQVITGGASRIHTIYLTHPHTDHVGQSNHLVQQSGAEVYLHQDCVEFFRERYKPGYNEEHMAWLIGNGLPDELYQRTLKTMPGFPVLPKTRPYEGDTLYLRDQYWRIMETPGHSPGHLTFYQPDDRILFAGDLVVEKQVPLIDVQQIRAHETVHDYLNSLEKVRPLDVDFVLSGHGNLFSNLQEKIDYLKAHHHKRIDQVRNAARGQWQSAFQIAQTIWPADRAFRIRLTICQTIGYLGYLSLEGQIQSRIEHGITQWQVT